MAEQYINTNTGEVFDVSSDRLQEFLAAYPDAKKLEDSTEPPKPVISPRQRLGGGIDLDLTDEEVEDEVGFFEGLMNMFKQHLGPATESKVNQATGFLNAFFDSAITPTSEFMTNVVDTSPLNDTDGFLNFFRAGDARTKQEGLYDSETGKTVSFDREAHKRDGHDAPENAEYYKLLKKRASFPIYERTDDGSIRKFENPVYLVDENGKKIDDLYKEELLKVHKKNVELNAKIAKLPITDSKGFVDAVKNGKVGDALLQSLNFITDAGIQFAAARLSFGTSMALQMGGMSYMSFNEEKAKALYGDDPDGFQKLLENGEDELGLPLLFGGLGFALERAGFKGITREIAKQSFKKRGYFGLLAASQKEAWTEYGQGLIERMNQNIGKQMSFEDAIKDVGSYMGSEEAWDQYFAGLIGGGALTAGGRKINAALRADESSSRFIAQKVSNIERLIEAKARTTSIKEQKKYDDLIQIQQEDLNEFLAQNSKLSEYLSTKQEDGLNNLLSNIRKTRKEIKEAKSLFNKGLISEQEFKALESTLKQRERSYNDGIISIKNDANMSLLMEELDGTGGLIKNAKNLQQQVFKTEAEFLDALKTEMLAKGKTEADFEKTTKGFRIDGLKIGGKLMINAEVAAQNNAIGIGIHEVLHGLLRTTVQGKDGNLSEKGELIVKDFIKTLSSNEKKLIEQALDDGNYRTGKEFKEYGEEYLNFYAQLSKQGAFEPTNKVGQFISNLFRTETEFKKVNFETGADTKAFLDAMVADSKKGIYRKEIQEFVSKQDFTIDDADIKFSKQAVDKLGSESELGDSFREKGVGKFLFDAEVDKIISDIENEGYLDGLIASKFKGDRVPKNFVKQVVAELTPHIKNFNPENNDSLFGWINSQIANKAGNVYNREYKADEVSRAKEIGERTEEGELKVQVEAETDTAIEQFEEEDVSIAARARQRKTKEQTGQEQEVKQSKLRKALGFETGGDMYSTILNSIKKSIVIAYRKTQNIKDTSKRAKAINELLRKEYFSLTSDVFKPLKNFFGAKPYIKNLKLHREAMFNSISVADLVQMERKVPENKRKFTTFIKQLTSKKEVEDAVRKEQLPLDALNKIDQGQAVNLYKRRIPTEPELVEFADQPAINPETGERSGLKGTRKDGFVKALGITLIKDATMEARQSEEVRSRIEDDGVSYEAEIQELAAAIGRESNIMFSRTQIIDGLADNVLDELSKLATGKTKLENIVSIEYDKKGKAKYSLKIPFKKRYEKGGREYSNSDKNKAAEIIYKMHQANEYGELKDEQLKQDLVTKIVKKSKPGEKINLGLALEYRIKSMFKKAVANTALQLKKGKGDIYVALNNIVVGVESKLDIARGVSQTINFLSNGNLTFANKNETANQDGVLYDDIIGSLIKDQYNQISKDLKKAGLDEIKNGNELTDAQASWLNDNKSKYSTSTNVDGNYFSWAYAHGKYSKMPQGFVQVGQKLYVMTTGNENVDKVSNAVAAEFNRLNPNNKIQRLKLKEGETIELVARIDRPKKGKIKYRISPRINEFKFVDSKANLLDASQTKSFIKSTETTLNSQLKIQNSRKLVNARDNSLKPSRGMSTFDFDETLIIEGKNFVTATKDGETVKIPSAKWPIDGPRYAEENWDFDFSDFVNVRGGKEGPLLQKMKNQIAKYGNKNVFVLTARMQEAAQPIHEWLKSKGINIPLENITGLGNSTGEAKALWMLDKYSEGYNDMYFVDDALPNVKAVQEVFNQLDVKGKSVQAKINFSRSLDQDFNKIIEEVTGIESEKRFSDIKARKRGSDKGKFRFFIPPSHEDFVGLLYNFMGKGRKGDKHRDFFEKALIKPLNRAYKELDTAMQAIANDFKALNKNYPDIKKKLKKNTADGDFTFEDAIRVYIWTKNGHEIPGLSKKDQDMLNEYVTLDPVLQNYANSIESISRVDGYIPPTESWDIGDLRSDLMDATGKVGRSQYFTEFIENSNEIFSKDNLNKIEAAYGLGVRESIEDMLYSIRTGEKRPQGQNKIVNQFVNFINGAVGTVMFFNMRSALLQQMSIVNYMNFADNNLYAMAKAFANQKQYWADWAFIFNSDTMKQRRGGIRTDVNAAELVQTASKSRFPMRVVIQKLLALGFTPTQIGDSIAISTGGATYYRNRTNKYIKEGLSQKEAELKAFDDFNEITQSTQQSAREDMISAQQRSAVGKFVLAFQNVTSQFNRLGKKAFLDLKNRRITPPYDNQFQSDVSNLARLTYYIGIQNMVFYSLQTALFMAMFDDEEELTEKEEKSRGKKFEYAVNGAIDSVLRGTGVYGAIAATVKNMAIQWDKQRDVKYNKDESAVLRAALDISPPLGIKARRIVAAEKTLNYNEKVIDHMKLSDIDNPIWPAVTSYFELVNIPLNKTYNKVQNIRQSLNKEHSALERVMMFFGWSQYNLDLENEKMKKIKEETKKKKKKKKKKEPYFLDI